MDENRKVIGFNEAACRLYGWQPEEVLGKDLPTIPDDPEEIAQFEDELRRVFAGEYITDLETKRKKRDGTIIPVRINCGPLRDTRGKIIAVITSISDATQRRLIETQLRQSQRVEAVGQLAGGIAHDFNNLLTVISGYCELAGNELTSSELQYGFVDTTIRQKLDEIRKAAGRAAHLTNQILAFSKRQVVEKRVISVNDVLRDMEKAVIRLIGEHIKPELCLHDPMPNIYADPNQLHQVLINLIVNARDAMPNGGTLTIATQPTASSVMIEVADSGTGMDKTTIEQIFEPFFSTKGARGTGLGLAIVKGIVTDDMHGKIDVYSEPGKGSVFVITLPITKMRALYRAADNKQETARGIESILVVEDEEAVRSMIEHSLRVYGYTATMCDDPSKALDLLRAGQRFDLLLTDVLMPTLNGVELVKLARELDPEMKVLYMSGYNESRDTKPFIAKPFPPGRLVRRIREILNNNSTQTNGGSP